MHDLAILGATLVTPRGRRPAHLYATAGRIAAITAERLSAREQLDASGLYLLPGAVDGHVHFQDPGDTSREDFISGSSAAAVGGITTVIEHTHSHPVVDPATLREKVQYLRDRSLVDFGLAAHAWPDRLDQAGPLWRAGIAFFKVFTCTTHGVPGFDTAALLALFRALAAIDALALVHCEDEAITGASERALREAGRTDPALLLEWRSREAELTALCVMALLARLTGVQAIAAHVSHPAALDLLLHERVLGARLAIETCPQYLYLREADVLEQGALRKFTPPARLRSEAERSEMWRRVAGGQVTHVSTDHAPSSYAHKHAGSMWEAHFGLPGVETTLTLLLNGVAEGLLSLERVVELVAEAPARLYRAYPQKGCLEVGADADLVLVDMSARRTLANEQVISRAGWTPYAGMRVAGAPVVTVSRGTVIAREGKPVAAPGWGCFLPGPGFSRS